MRKIIFEFLRADRSRGDSQPEKVFIAIKSVFGIHDFIKDQSPCELESYYMTAFMPAICDHFSQLLQSLDGIFGNWLNHNQSRTVYGK